MKVAKNRPPATIRLSAANYNQKFNPPKEGDKIKLGRNSWFLSKQRIKNKQMVHRMLKKEYYPYMVVTKSFGWEGEHTLTVKPYNF